MNSSWGEPYDRILVTPKREWEDYHIPRCDFQGGFFQCRDTLQQRYSPKLETYYMYCQTCGSAYPVLETGKKHYD